MGDVKLHHQGRNIMANKCGLFLTFGLTAIACVFLLVSMVAWDDDCKNIKNTAWARVEKTVSSDEGTATVGVGVGLRGLGIWEKTSVFGHEVSDTCTYTAFDDLTDASDVAQDCQDAGEVGLAGCLLGFGCLALGALMTLTRCCTGGQCLKITNILLPSISLILTAAAATFFKVHCFDKQEDIAVGDNVLDLDLYIGFIGAVLAACMSGLLAGFHCCLRADNGDNDRTVVLLRS